jgi:hypothetical protein
MEREEEMARERERKGGPERESKTKRKESCLSQQILFLFHFL